MGDTLHDLLTTPLADLAARSDTRPFDAVVVGGGSAGISAARRLCEGGLRVAVLEGGPLALLSHVQSTDLRFNRTLTRNLQTALQYSPTGSDGAPFGSLIGCVGGRGMFWNGAAPRFAARDFAAWPFAIGELDEHYAWAEREYCVNRSYADGPLAQLICRALRKAGIAAEPGPYAVDSRSSRDGFLAGMVGNALAPLLRCGLLGVPDGLLTLTVRAFARKILPEDGAAAGVEVVDLETGAVATVRARAVVLAAGGFESVRLAQVSDIADDNGLIGRNISDHLFCRAYFPLPPTTYDPARPEIAIVWSPADDDKPYQLELHMPNDYMFTAHDGMHWAPDKSVDYAAMIRSFGAVASRPDNLIRPLPGDKPGAFQVTLSLSEADLALRDRMVAAITTAGAAIGADPAEVQVMPSGASHHEAGGLPIGTDPATSVADPWGRMRAIRHLVVADAAAWPTVSPANPHLTIVACARRAGARLLADLES